MMTAELAMAANSNGLRPIRSLSIPLANAPPTPANSQIASAAPAAHRLAPSVFRKVGKNTLRQVSKKSRKMTMMKSGINKRFAARIRPLICCGFSVRAGIWRSRQ